MVLLQQSLKHRYIWVEQTEPFTPGSNTIAYYPLNSTTTVNDQSGNGYNMTNSGGTFGTYQGVDCVALSNSTYLSTTVSAIPQGNNPSTLLCRCYIISYDSNEHGIFGYGRNSTHSSYQIMYSDNNLGIRTYYDDCLIYPISSYIGQRMLLVGTTDGTTITLYRNGTSVATVSHSQNIQDTTLYIGKGIVSYGINGYVSRAILENKARTASEILTYYNNSKSLYGIS